MGISIEVKKLDPENGIGRRCPRCEKNWFAAFTYNFCANCGYSANEESARDELARIGRTEDEIEEIIRLAFKVDFDAVN